MCNCVFCDISAIIVQQLTRRCMGSSHSPYLHRCRQLRPRREMVSVAWFTAQISDSEPKRGYYRSTSTLMKTMTWNSNPYKKYRAQFNCKKIQGWSTKALFSIVVPIAVLRSLKFVLLCNLGFSLIDRNVQVLIWLNLLIKIITLKVKVLI